MQKCRGEGRLLGRWDVQEARGQPDRFDEKLVEVVGRFFGVEPDGEHERIIARRAWKGAAEEIAARVRAPNRASEWDFLEPGQQVRLLCYVLFLEEGSPPVLQVRMPVSEAEWQVYLARQTVRTVRIATLGKTAPGVLVRDYSRLIQRFNRNVALGQAREIAAVIVDCSRRSRLDPRIALCLIAQESAFNVEARNSRSGATGLGQLMPATAKELGVTDATNLVQNVSGSVRYLTRQLSRWSPGRSTFEALRLALASYNAGPGNVAKYGGIPPFPETQHYVRRITRLYWQLLDDRERSDWLRRGWLPS